MLPKATPLSQRVDEPDHDFKVRLQKRVAELQNALCNFANDVERIYGKLPAGQYPGPPTSLVALMRGMANGNKP